MPAFSSLIYLIFGCQETPPYDLSQIPIKDEDPALSTPSTPSATSTSPPPLTRDGSTNKPPMKCLPPNETEKEIDLEGKIAKSSWTSYNHLLGILYMGLYVKEINLKFQLNRTLAPFNSLFS